MLPAESVSEPTRQESPRARNQEDSTDKHRQRQADINRWLNQRDAGGPPAGGNRGGRTPDPGVDLASWQSDHKKEFLSGR